MTYALGPKSLAQLDTVHPRLRGVIERAIGITTQDFTVVQGLRTTAEAKANTAAGTSRTNNSLHLMQPDGTAHAVDLAAWDDSIAWEPPALYYAIATAMRQAARDLGVTIRWGGQWDRTLNTLQGDLGQEHMIYAQTFQKAHGRPALIDLGHFELPRGVPISDEVKA